jgi:hypothetical protein
MIASGQDVKRLLAFGSRDPRKPPQAAALRGPEAVPGSIKSENIAGEVSWGPSGTFFNRLTPTGHFLNKVKKQAGGP